jgi:malic enzyme
MVLTAARTLASMVSEHRLRDGALYPAIGDLRSVSRELAIAVGREALRSGLADAATADSLETDVDAAMWWPAYVPYVPA